MKNSWVNSATLYATEGLTKKQLEVRDVAINDLRAFITLCAPFQVLGHCHEELADWLTYNDSNRKLLLWPRDHCKSRNAAFYTTWKIIRNPAITSLYASATGEKAEEQMRFIKNILLGKPIQKYFPGLIEPEEGKRKLWNNSNIIVDHPARENAGVVDSTIMTCGITKNITGKHYDLAVFDDLVVRTNNTQKGRSELREWYADISSIMSTDSEIFAVGTRYHPNDLYGSLLDLTLADDFDEDGNPMGTPSNLYEVKQDSVEVDGDFLWPRSRSKMGRWFGFNYAILAQKRKEREIEGGSTSFFAQYYNDPNDESTSPIPRKQFQYIDKTDFNEAHGSWYIKDTILSLYCAIDMAYSESEESDYTAIIVGGIDDQGNRYTVHVERFKTDKPSVIYKRLKKLYIRYKYKKLRIESVSAANMLAKEIERKLIKDGIRIPVDFFKPSSVDGEKAIRIHNTLEPLYAALCVYHYRGGDAEHLERELTSAKPANDDLKDCWYMCNDLMDIPLQRKRSKSKKVLQFNSRFGGVSY